MFHHSSPPSGWAAFDYTSPPTSPHYVYYASPFANPYASPRGTSKRHNRKASYSTPRETGPWHPGYSHGFYEPTPDYCTPPRKHDHVSASFGGPKYKPAHQRRHTTTGTRAWDGWDHEPARPSRTQRRPVVIDVADDVFDDAPRTIFREPRKSSGRSAARHAPQPTAHRRDEDGHAPARGSHAKSHGRKPKPSADKYFYFTQVRNSEDVDAARRSRARRQSTSTRTPSKPKPTAATAKPPRQATEEDAARAGIPPGYSIKNWDPTEAPIILLGSVFDANSLGKWIYDWTVFHHGASTPMADVAGDLWLLLIKLAGKVKRADACLPRIHRPEAQEVVEDFLESGERLWARFKKLLKACEHYMWKAAKRDGGEGSVSMGRNAGCEFVESIFGRDRELENTEKLMNSIRLWIMRFDANCEDILRRPLAA